MVLSNRINRKQLHLIKTNSYKKGFVASISLNVVAKGILFLNTVVIAYFFGTSLDTDLYFFVFSLVSLIAAFINGTDLAVIIPEGMHLQEKEGKDAAIQFYNFFGFIYLCIGLALFILLLLFALPVYNAISTFENNILAGNRLLLVLSSVLPLFMILSNYLSTVLTTLKYFTAPLVVSMIVQMLVLISLVLFHGSLGITAAIIGMIAGYALNLVMLLFLMHFKLNWRFHLSWPALGTRIKRNLLSVQLGNLATFAYSYGIILILSGMATGVYSAYSYSMQVVNVPINFIVTQAAAVVGIKFNELSTKNQHNHLNKTFQESTGILLFLVIPLCFLTSLYAEEIIKILFLRGGFTHDSVAKVSFFLRFLIYLTPCLLLMTLITRAITAVRKVGKSFYFQIGFNIISLGLLLAATHFFGEYGFVITIISSHYLYILIACFFLLKWLMPFIDYASTLKALGMLLLFNIPFTILCYTIFGIDQPLVVLVLIGLVYYLTILIVNYFVRANNSVNLYFTYLVRFVFARNNSSRI
jgi:putative peptidoglycan lipid II flippase